MSKVLIVDNLTVHLPRLVDLVKEKLPASEVLVETTREVTERHVKQTDLVILSGGTGRSLEKNPETFRRLVDLVVANKKPSIGICLGAEAIAVYFGGSLQKMPFRRVGNIKITLGKLLAGKVGKSEIMAYEFHKWLITDVGGELEVMATSKDRVEVFRHKKLKLFGIQFHPEVRHKNNQGHQVFDVLIRQAGLI